MLIAQVGAFVFLLLSALCVKGPYQPDRASDLPKHSVSTRQKADGIPGFGEVTPRLYRGGQPNIEGMETLKEMGVDIVVNMRGGRNKKEEGQANQLGMQYVSIPWHCPVPRDITFARFLRLIRDNPGKKIFVHCRLGDDRTGMAIAAYRMAEEGWSADAAMKEMRAFGFVGVHHVICPTLSHYEKTFPKRLKTSPAFRELPPHRTATSK
jgi:tyrosine-protein phosphatase SIW14